MSFLDLIAFAWTSMTGHRLRAGLCMLGVSIGVTSVILLTALGEGARIYVTGQLASLGSDLVIVLPGRVETSGTAAFAGGVPHDLTLSDAETLQRLPHVSQLAPALLGETDVDTGALHRSTTILGTTADFFSLRKLGLHSGSFLPDGDMERPAPVCVIGTTIQQDLFGTANPLGKIVRVGNWRFRVVGVLEQKGEGLGMNLDEMVVIPVASAMKMFNQSSLFRVIVKATSVNAITPLKNEIKETIMARHNKEEDVTLVTQDSVLSAFNQIFLALTLALAGIAAISLTVAGIGIMNVMLVSVSERTSEVGLLKAIGVKPIQIVSAFLAEAALLSVVGGIAGLIIAKLAVQASIQLYPSFPIQVPAWTTPAAIAVALGVGILFGVLPAKRASKLDPILALSRR